MSARRLPAVASIVLAACQSYSPAPVDLDAHAATFAARLGDAESVRAFAEQLRQRGNATPFGLDDGIDLAEAHAIALWFEPSVRLARLRAGVARAAADEAGRWLDPQLTGSLFRQDGTPHPWIAAAGIALSLPLTGRLGKEQDLADRQLDKALVEARLAEAALLRRIDLTWVQWSAAQQTLLLLQTLATQLGDLEAIAARLADAGHLTQVEHRAFTLARLGRKAELERARGTTRELELELRQLLGLPPDAPWTFVAAIPATATDSDPARSAAALPQSAAVALPRCEHEVAERELALAIAQQWPDLALEPGWQEEDGRRRLGLGFSLPLPLWNGNSAAIAKATAEREVRAEALRAAIEIATQQLARAEARLAAARNERAVIEQELLPIAEQQIASVQKLAELGQLDTVLLLDAVVRVHDAKVAALTAAVAESEATIHRDELFWPDAAVSAEENPK